VVKMIASLWASRRRERQQLVTDERKSAVLLYSIRHRSFDVAPIVAPRPTGPPSQSAPDSPLPGAGAHGRGAATTPRRTA
jgi:hypothetical protein